MIIQLVNIAGGALLASGKIARALGEERVNTLTAKVEPYRSSIGVVVAAIGALSLIERATPLHFGLPLGSSYPQAIPAILVGLLLSTAFFGKYPAVKRVIEKLAPYSAWIGIVAIVCGLGSLLFGCILPVVCPSY